MGRGAERGSASPGWVEGARGGGEARAKLKLGGRETTVPSCCCTHVSAALGCEAAEATLCAKEATEEAETREELLLLERRSSRAGGGSGSPGGCCGGSCCGGCCPAGCCTSAGGCAEAWVIGEDDSCSCSGALVCSEKRPACRRDPAPCSINSLPIALWACPRALLFSSAGSASAACTRLIDCCLSICRGAH